MSPLPDPHYFWGIGKGEVVYRMQAFANKIASKKADSTELNMQPMWIVSRLADLHLPLIRTEAGKIIEVSGPANDENIRPIRPDMAPFQLAMEELMMVSRHMQQGLGVIDDVSQGLTSSGRNTATEISVRAESSLSRIGMEIRRSEEEWLEPLFNWFHHFNRRFLTVPKQVQILGTEAIIDKITGLPIPIEQLDMTVDVDDLRFDYRATAQGATKLLSKSLRQDQLLKLYSLVASNPVGFTMINWYSFFRYIFQIFDLPNVNDFFVNAIPMVNQMVQESGMSPQGMLGGMDQQISQIEGGLGGSYQ